MDDYTHLRLHEARTRRPTRPVGAPSGRRRPGLRWSRRLLRAVTAGDSGTRDGEADAQVPVARPAGRTASV